jgi:hypothetical protein
MDIVKNVLTWLMGRNAFRKTMTQISVKDLRYVAFGKPGLNAREARAEARKLNCLFDWKHMVAMCKSGELLASVQNDLDLIGFAHDTAKAYDAAIKAAYAEALAKQIDVCHAEALPTQVEFNHLESMAEAMQREADAELERLTKPAGVKAKA